MDEKRLVGSCSLCLAQTHGPDVRHKMLNICNEEHCQYAHDPCTHRHFSKTCRCGRLTNLSGLLHMEPLAIVLQQKLMASRRVLQRKAVHCPRSIDAHAGSCLHSKTSGSAHQDIHSYKCFLPAESGLAAGMLLYVFLTVHGAGCSRQLLSAPHEQHLISLQCDRQQKPIASRGVPQSNAVRCQ